MSHEEKVRVFAAYQIGIGPKAKMIGDESKNKFEVTLSTGSNMLREIEEILYKRHAEEIAKIPGCIIVIHHFQLITF